MFAIRVHAFEPDNLVYEETEQPQAGPGEVLIRNQAAGVNPIDWKTCSGGGASGFIEQFPFIPGWEFSGIIEACGEGVDAFKVGDAVLGFIRFPSPASTYAEYLTAPADQIALRPEGLDALTAGGLGLAGLTAWQALFDKGELKTGQKVLVLAGAGGVGHLAVQLAAIHEADVSATCSTANIEFLKRLGCQEVIDYTRADMRDYANTFDLIIDGVGGDTAINALITLKPGGRMVTLPSVTAAQVAAAAEGTDVTVEPIRVVPNPQQLASLANFVAEGKLTLKLAKTFPLSDAAAAHKLSATGKTVGKILLSVSE